MSENYDKKTAQCATCRFWLPDPDGPQDHNDPAFGFGSCRLEPPKIVTPLAKLAMGKLRFGQQFDPQDVFSVTDAYDASSFPGTYMHQWCGRFEWIPRLSPMEGPC